MTYWKYLIKVGRRRKKEEDRKVLLKLLLTRAKDSHLSNEGSNFILSLLEVGH